MEFVKTTQVELRNLYYTFPGFGLVDDYQFILFMTAHSKRYTHLLEEVKMNPDFPKK